MVVSAIILLAVCLGLWLRCWTLHDRVNRQQAAASRREVEHKLEIEVLEDEVDSLTVRLHQSNGRVAARVLERDQHIWQAQYLEASVARMARSQGVPEYKIEHILAAARQPPRADQVGDPEPREMDDEVTVPLPSSVRTSGDVVDRAERCYAAALGLESETATAPLGTFEADAQEGELQVVELGPVADVPEREETSAEATSDEQIFPSGNTDAELEVAS